jgi:3-(3-hydroxy-phenyl)propionate hydroxylase
MNSGVRDAHNLAWKLAAVVRGQAGPSLLQSYESERRHHVGEMIQLALTMGRIMSPRSWLSGFLTQAAFLALNLCPPARDYVVQMKYKPQPRFTSGFLVPDGKSARRTLVGRLFPQPRVLTADGAHVLLDEVLGNRFVLLARTARPEVTFAAFTQPVWDRLDARRVAVVPAGAAPIAGPGVTVVSEEGDALATALAAYPDHVLLLRPDHYVAAAIPLADVARGAKAVAALVDATWTLPEQQQPQQQRLNRRERPTTDARL